MGRKHVDIQFLKNPQLNVHQVVDLISIFFFLKKYHIEVLMALSVIRLIGLSCWMLFIVSEIDQ